MSKHVEEAKEWLRDAPVEQHGGDVERAMLCVGMAQAEATLALVEQQRIANLIALATVPADGVLAAQPAFDARAALVEYREHDNPEMGGWLELRPEIARALGLGVSDG